MELKSEEIINRYRYVEKIADSRGRIFSVGRLKPSQLMDIRTMLETEDATVLGVYRAAASIRAMNDVLLHFPANKNDLKANLDLLDEEGLEAVFKALRKLNGEDVEEPSSTAPNAES